jgi:hypothetical protein
MFSNLPLLTSLDEIQLEQTGHDYAVDDCFSSGVSGDSSFLRVSNWTDPFIWCVRCGVRLIAGDFELRR